MSIYIVFFANMRVEYYNNKTLMQQADNIVFEIYGVVWQCLQPKDFLQVGPLLPVPHIAYAHLMILYHLLLCIYNKFGASDSLWASLLSNTIKINCVLYNIESKTK